MRWTQKPPLGIPINWAHPLARGIEGCWMLNEGAGDRIYDLSGRGTEGILSAMDPITDWSVSEHGAAIDFNGTDDYISLGTTPLVSTLTTASVEAMIRLAAAGHDDGEAIYCERSAGTPIWKFQRGQIPNKDHIEFVHRDDANQLTFVTGTSIALASGTWYYIVLSKEGTAITLYVDGKEAGSGTLNGGDVLTAANTRIASDQQGANAYLEGSVAWLRVRNVALQASEVIDLYASPYAMFEWPTVFQWYAPAAVGNPWYYYAQQQ